jgi:anion-transporting  ArsA/GET3 family ATPase
MERMDLLSRRFIVVTGKGGVGKSAVAAAIALAVAGRGRRVLVASLHRSGRTAGFLGAGPAPGRVFEAGKNIHAVTVTPAASLREYGLMILKFERLYRRVFEDRIVKYLLEALPSLEELLMLGKTWYHTQERARTGAWRFDTVVMDSQATGHALSMLALPGTIVKAAPPGPLKTKADEIRATLTDPARAALCVVATPEEMPVSEAVEICAVNGREIGIPPGYLFINRAIDPMFTRDELRSPAAARPGILGRAFFCAEFREAAARSQARHLARARRDVPLAPVALPEVACEEFGMEELRLLASVIGRECDGQG